MKIKLDYFPQGLSVMNNQLYLNTHLWLKRTRNIKICAKKFFTVYVDAICYSVTAQCFRT